MKQFILRIELIFGIEELELTRIMELNHELNQIIVKRNSNNQLENCESIHIKNNWN